MLQACWVGMSLGHDDIRLDIARNMLVRHMPYLMTETPSMPPSSPLPQQQSTTIAEATDPPWNTIRTFPQASQRMPLTHTLVHAHTDCIHSTPVLCWGHKILPTQKGITTYRLSANRLKPFAHAGHNAVFNTARRMRHQFLYVVPPFVAAYFLARWMDER